MVVFVCCLGLLPRGTVEVLEQKHSDEGGKAQSLRVGVFASLVDDGRRKRNACGTRPLMWWDFGMGHS